MVRKITIAEWSCDMILKSNKIVQSTPLRVATDD